MENNLDYLICFANAFKELTKISYIRKIPGGYRVFSEKGRNLGTYKTREEAEKRLKQIHFFKFLGHKKANKTYTSIIRSLNDNADEDTKNQFQKIFKEIFDQAILNNESSPEEIALNKAVEYLDGVDKDLVKKAAPIQMGSPEEAGKFLATIVQFLMRRIAKENRQKSLLNLKNKIKAIDENVIASKKLPSSSSLGQAISLIKNVLMTHPPSYVRATLNSIVNNL